MTVIWKFKLAITDQQYVKMPAGAELLGVAQQGYYLCLGAAVDPDARSEERDIEIFGTGNQIPEPQGHRRHVGTVSMNVNTNGLVWHVFERLDRMKTESVE